MCIRDRCPTEESTGTPRLFEDRFAHDDGKAKFHAIEYKGCLLYTSDAADERSSVDLGGRRIIKKKKADTQHSPTTDSRIKMQSTK